VGGRLKTPPPATPLGSRSEVLLLFIPKLDIHAFSEIYYVQKYMTEI